MRKVTVKTSELLDIVRVNREKHITEYNEACSGYKEKALEWLTKCTKDLRSEILRMKDDALAKVNAFIFGLDLPVTHEKDYDQVIRMLELSVEDTTSLESDEFSCYVMDDWKWKQQWTHSNTQYKK